MEGGNDISNSIAGSDTEEDDEGDNDADDFGSELEDSELRTNLPQT
jgi:hypothetical protein